MSESAAALPPLVLASASPRRHELLTSLGVEFVVEPADIDESVRADEQPEPYVRRMAVSKAQAVAARQPAAAVLGADTAVVIGSRILGKPADEADGLAMLDLLSGRTHRVYTALALVVAGQLRERMAVTEVDFRVLTAAEQRAYWASGEPADKAGGYAVQGLGAVFVRELRGSYTGVVGLPLFECAELLTEAGYPLILSHNERRDSD